MDVFSIAIGAAGVGVAYFIFLAATKGLPVAVAWIKAKWNAGKTDLAALETRITALEAKVVSLIRPAAPAAPVAPAAAPVAPLAPAVAPAAAPVA